jgi:hypothetical protein
LQPKKCSGVDGVTSFLLKTVSNEITPYLTILINKTIASHEFPDKLKIAKVVALYKKGEKSSLSNYRPISILPCISKIFERLLHDQIYSFVENNNLFCETQFGFRKNSSTEYTSITWWSTF